MRQTLNFAFERETKGAVRYFECDSNGERRDEYSVGTLYLRKTAFSDGKYPQRLVMTLSEGPAVLVRKRA